MVGPRAVCRNHLARGSSGSCKTRGVAALRGCTTERFSPGRSLLRHVWSKGVGMCVAICRGCCHPSCLCLHPHPRSSRCSAQARVSACSQVEDVVCAAASSQQTIPRATAVEPWFQCAMCSVCGSIWRLRTAWTRQRTCKERSLLDGLPVTCTMWISVHTYRLIGFRGFGVNR